jgi:hypothetical protein
MTQNLTSLTLTEAQLAYVAHSLADIQLQLSALIASKSDERGSTDMGEKSATLCRNALNLLSKCLPAKTQSVSSADAQANQVAVDKLLSRISRLRRLSEMAMGEGMVPRGDDLSKAVRH